LLVGCGAGWWVPCSLFSRSGRYAVGLGGAADPNNEKSQRQESPKTGQRPSQGWSPGKERSAQFPSPTSHTRVARLRVQSFSEIPRRQRGGGRASGHWLRGPPTKGATYARGRIAGLCLRGNVLGCFGGRWAKIDNSCSPKTDYVRIILLAEGKKRPPPGLYPHDGGEPIHDQHSRKKAEKHLVGGWPRTRRWDRSEPEGGAPSSSSKNEKRKKRKKKSLCRKSCLVKDEVEGSIRMLTPGTESAHG